MTDLFGYSSDSILFTTFNGIADSYESNRDVDEALNEYAEEIEEIANHLLAIADSWKSAGEALSVAIGHTQQSLLTQLIIVAASFGVIIVVVVIIIKQRR